MATLEPAIVQLLRFQVGTDVFALPIERVLQIVDRRPVTRVPNLAATMAGVFNHEGAITPVVDMAAKFRIDRKGAPHRSCIVIVSADHDGDAVPIGLLTDGVLDVVPVRPADIEPAPSFGTRLRLEYLAGLTKIGDEFTLILNVDRFLTADELLDLAAARDSAIEMREPVPGMTNEILTFRAAGRMWGIPLHDVDEIVSVSRVIHLPLTPDTIAGVIAVRGSAVGAVDFARLTGAPSDRCESAIVINDSRRHGKAAFLVDSVRDVVEVGEVQSSTMPDFTWVEGIAGSAAVVNVAQILDGIARSAEAFQ